ncbi:MAG: hypothetical protein K2P81_00425 [Bacteriovoracaceae bacterium]|nr:hypothetical protein [Bacteriovoracaceae bacterium]
MSFCYLTAHRESHASKRIMSEAQKMGLKLDILNPLHLRLNTFSQPQKYSKTLNRFSAVDAHDPYIFTVMESPLWGEQFNSWEVRSKLWDKSRQTLWMNKVNWPTTPIFAFRGPITVEDESWREFKKLNPQGWVLKVNRGQKGIGIHFFKEEDSLFAWLETLWRLGDQDFIIQPELSVMREYRVTYLQSKPWAILERSADSAKKNFAQGGEARELKGSECPKNLSGLIEKMAELKAHHTSIDLLETDKGLFVSDINLVPGFEQLENVTGRNFASDLLKVIF